MYFGLLTVTLSQECRVLSIWKCMLCKHLYCSRSGCPTVLHSHSAAFIQWCATCQYLQV